RLEPHPRAQGSARDPRDRQRRRQDRGRRPSHARGDGLRRGDDRPGRARQSLALPPAPGRTAPDAGGAPPRGAGALRGSRRLPRGSTRCGADLPQPHRLVLPRSGGRRQLPRPRHGAGDRGRGPSRPRRVLLHRPSRPPFPRPERGRRHRLSHRLRLRRRWSRWTSASFVGKMPAMRLGGFVIHGNNRETLGDCLDSLLSVCDEVVAVDSCSTDGSAEIVRSRGVRSVVLPWHGYGAARQAAARELANCDYLFFLDSDERLAPEAAEAIAGWRRSNPHLPHYLLPRRDWVQFPSRSFVLRTEWHVRLVRRDAATWKPEMIVHEALPRRPAARLRAPIEHRFMTSTEELEAKQDWYALLWAVQAHASGRRPGRAWLARPVHVL